MAAPVYSVLNGAAGVTALVSNRIYEDTAPQDAVRPYITWSYGGGRANPYLGDVPGIDNPVVQIDIWATSSAQRQAIYEAVIAAMDPVANMLQQPMSGWEFETKLYRLMLEYSFWIPRS